MTRDYIELVSPVAPEPAAVGSTSAESSVRAAAAGGSLANIRVSIVENSKSNARQVLEALRSMLVEQHAAVAGITVRKPVSGPIEAADLAALHEGSDLVLVGSAD